MEQELSFDDKKRMIEDIKKLNDIQLYQIFMMVKDNTNKFTQNSNGVFVNLKNLSPDIIIKIHNYIDECLNINNKNTQDTKKEYLPLQTNYNFDENEKIDDESDSDESDEESEEEDLADDI